MNWIKKVISRIAEEVHKSKIEELEKRVAEIEKDHMNLKESLEHIIIHQSYNLNLLPGNY